MSGLKPAIVGQAGENFTTVLPSHDTKQTNEINTTPIPQVGHSTDEI